MVNVIVKPDRNNSPTKVMLRDFVINFAELKSNDILEVISNNIIWEIVGYSKIVGFDAFKDYLGKIRSEVNELIIQSIVVDGNEGAVAGEMTMSTGEKYSFGDFYQFSTGKETKIAHIKSFNIKQSLNDS